MDKQQRMLNKQTALFKRMAKDRLHPNSKTPASLQFPGTSTSTAASPYHFVEQLTGASPVLPQRPAENIEMQPLGESRPIAGTSTAPPHAVQHSPRPGATQQPLRPTTVQHSPRAILPRPGLAPTPPLVRPAVLQAPAQLPVRPAVLQAPAQALRPAALRAEAPNQRPAANYADYDNRGMKPADQTGAGPRRPSGTTGATRLPTELTEAQKAAVLKRTEEARARLQADQEKKRKAAEARLKKKADKDAKDKAKTEEASRKRHAKKK